MPLILFYLKKKDNWSTLESLLIGIFLGCILMLFYAWWSHYSKELLLEFYGFNFDYMNNLEKLEKVSKVNLERVNNLERSIMGIGWPLKASFGMVIYLPYLIISYFVLRLLNSARKA